MRPYQIEAIKQTERALRSDPGRVQVVSLPTGSGKTLVALHIACRHLRRHPTGKVLWLANRWELVAQASCGLINTDMIASSNIGRVGKGLPQFRETLDARFVFSTVQTWCSRSAGGHVFPLPGRDPLLVVVDECHWAAKARLGKELLSQFLGKASVLGLSATPSLDTTTHRIAYAKSFADLCPEYLAVPTVQAVATGETWNPIFSGDCIRSDALADLGNREDRNEKIVSTFLRGYGAGKFARTVIFACDVEHANKLAQQLSRRGVACRAVHSSQVAERNNKAIADFRNGQLNVLVTVEMLTEGFDVPEIDTIFLARPTSSLTLLAQMVGRGARKTEKKDKFRIIEFTDSVKQMGSRLFHAEDYVNTKPTRASYRSTGRAIRHAEPEDTPKFEDLVLDGVVGIPFTKDQTFGVEIELSARGSYEPDIDHTWARTAQEIIRCIQRVAVLPVCDRPLDYHQSSDTTQWRVTYDASCGWEIVSPILVNAEGFAELARVSEAVTDLVERSPNLRVNAQTGLHITLATRLNTPERRHGFAARLTRLEAGLFTLVAPSRLFQWLGNRTYSKRSRNEYCKPLRELTLQTFNQCVRQWSFPRYHSINLRRMNANVQLLEVRMHQGTTEYQKIIPWISLWMQIFNHSRYAWEGHPEFGKVYPGGNRSIGRETASKEDIFRLLQLEGIVLPVALKRMLWERREQLRSSWMHAVPRRVQVWTDAGWYDAEYQPA
ncbi:DEAD/DEAH box helicase [Stieleria maiorica]|uniref:DEAD/DEAH box helicase n=1 Tax=Stieleria maiorica TaxID=2795974 RepID=UPI00142F2CA8|nr:DEAD/DEAH box helicase [Stieleria maiorica]